MVKELMTVDEIRSAFSDSSYEVIVAKTNNYYFKGQYLNVRYTPKNESMATFQAVETGGDEVKFKLVSF